MNEKAFLGKGLKFPIQINKVTGRFVTVSEEMSVKESIYIILMTQKGERFTRREFGSNILEYTFMDISITRMNMMARELEDTLLSQEPRISSVDVDIEPQLDKGCLIINIGYTITEENVRDNLVFPFYLNLETEVEEDGSME